jgi:hypothetical protein
MSSLFLYHLSKWFELFPRPEEGYSDKPTPPEGALNERHAGRNQIFCPLLGRFNERFLATKLIDECAFEQSRFSHHKQGRTSQNTILEYHPL